MASNVGMVRDYYGIKFFNQNYSIQIEVALIIEMG